MNRRGVELGIGSIAVVILFALTAFIVLSMVFTYQPAITGGLKESVCKISVFFRAATLGNPLVESLLGAAGTLTGGFGGVAVSLISIPLACFPGEALDYTGSVGMDELTPKLMNEAVRCWDMFGEGRWDVLIMYEKGNQFTCFEQQMVIKCEPGSDAEWFVNLFGAEYSEKYYTELGGSDSRLDIGQNFFELWKSRNRITVADVQKTYSDYLREGNPLLGVRGAGAKYNIICDGKPRSYMVGLYFIDDFFQAPSRVRVPTQTICAEIKPGSGDLLVLCTLYLEKVEVT